MASSSVSQESLDRDESNYEFAPAASTTRSRARVPRTMRTRGGSANLHKSESQDSPDTHNGFDSMSGSVVEAHGDGGGGAGGGGPLLHHHHPPGAAGLIGHHHGAAGAPDHDSPTRSAASRAKEREKRARPNHLQKGKTAKDKRKLREKRRSTGVVHLPSESTGDSLDEEEGDKLTGETKRNTSYNEVIDADNPQTPEESRCYNRARNKSPSDLEADLEDNQDYDSTVSQSETNLTTIGQASPVAPVPSTHITSGARLPSSLRTRMSNQDAASRTSGGSSSSHYHHHGSSAGERDSFARPISYPSRFRESDRDLESAPLGSRSLLGSRGSQGDGSSAGLHRSGSRDSYHNYRDRGERGSNYSSISSANTAEMLRLQARSSELERLLEQEREEKRRLEKQIEQEREEKTRLRQMLDTRDLQVSELQREIGLLGEDFDLCCEDNEKLQQENAALVRAFKQLSVT